MPGSDADILILLKDDKRRFVERMPEFSRCFLDVSIATDIFPYTVYRERNRRKTFRQGFFYNHTLERESITYPRKVK